MRPGLTAVEDRRLSGLDGDHLHVGLALLEHLADAGDRAAGADAGDDDVDGAVGVAPDLLGGGLAVHLGVGRVRELAGEDGAVTLGGDLLGLRHGALHALGGGGEDEFGAEALEQRATLLRHRLGHRQHDVVALGGADHGERDAGVARGRLDDRPGRLQLAGGLRGLDDRLADAVLDGGGGVAELELRRDGDVGGVDDAVDAHERRVADGLSDVGEDGHEGGLSTVAARPISPQGGEQTRCDDCL